MKRLVVCITVVLMLAGCGSTDAQLQSVMQLRERLLQMNGCNFQAEVCANYEDSSYSFSMSCAADSQGNVTFTVVEPQSISGISGRIHAQGGQLTFDDEVLGFPLLADGEVSPVSAPWILIRTLLGGYISSCVKEGDDLHVTMDDSYLENAMRLEVWLNGDNLPQCAEIVWQGRRVLSITVESFEIL